jgi:orotate phosphoribosyltransferase
MHDYQTEFISFAIDTGVLRFGEFTLKSGRQSPYFFNAGLFNTGAALSRLGRFYAQAIIESGIQFDVIFGPAYKGIPLVAITAAALYDQYDMTVGYSFNRKETKDHGEGGIIVGHPLVGKILVIDDVVSAGVSTRESVDIIHAHDAECAGLVVSLDRQERGQGELSAIQEIRRDLNIPVSSIVELQQLISYLRTDPDYQDHLVAIERYQEKFGVIG